MNRKDIEIIRNNLLFQVFERADHDALTLKLIEEAFEEVLQLQKKTITEEEILQGAIQQDTIEQQLAWGEGAEWAIEKLK